MLSADHFTKQNGLILRIFLDNRSVCLLDHPVDSLAYNGNGIEFRSRKQLREVVENFENDATLKNLFIWENPDVRKKLSASEDLDSIDTDPGDGLLPCFLSLFKIVKAAGGLVKNEAGEWLFIFRRGKWDLPKGKISGPKSRYENTNYFSRNSVSDNPAGNTRKKRKKPTESPREAAIREVKEETGIRNVVITKELPVTFHIYYQKGKRILKPVYWFEMFASCDQDLVPETKEDIEVVKWIDSGDLKEILSNTYASVREILSGYGYTIHPDKE